MISFCISPVKTKGYSVFSNENIEANILIGPYITNEPQKIGRRLTSKFWETLLGRYVNHNNTPNSYLINDGNVMNLYSNCKIMIGEEIVCDYREVEIMVSVSEGTYYRSSFIQTIATNYGL